MICPAAWTCADVTSYVLLQDPHAPRTQTGSPRAAALGDIRSPHSSDRPISPTVPLPAHTSSSSSSALHGTVRPHGSPKAAAAAALSSTAVHQLLNRHAPQTHQYSRQQQQQPQRATQQLGAGASGMFKAAGAAGAAATDEVAVVDALMKYRFYQHFGIDPQHVAPYKEEWLQAALALVPPPRHVSQVRPGLWRTHPCSCCFRIPSCATVLCGMLEPELCSHSSRQPVQTSHDWDAHVQHNWASSSEHVLQGAEGLHRGPLVRTLLACADAGVASQHARHAVSLNLPSSQMPWWQ